MRMLRAGRWITAIGLLLLAGVYVRALVYTPVERLQGLAQKIFYVHVPAAIWAESAMIFVGLASVFYLFLKDPRLDRFAEASAEVGTVFAAIVLTTGPIWGKPIWGTWWTWDARLTLTLFLFLLYVGYQLLRGDMLVTWLLSVGVFTLLYIGFVTQRYALSYLREQLEVVGEGGRS